MNTLGIVAGQGWPPAGGGGDPYFSSVVLLLHGSDFLDYSSHAFGPATVGGGVTLDNSVTNGTVGDYAYRVIGSGSTAFQFPACPEFKRASTYTLEYWVYFDAIASNNLAMCPTSFARFLQFTDGTPNSNVGAQGWCPNSPSPASVGAWHWIVIAYDGTDCSQYIDGTRVSSGTFSLPTDATNQDMDVISSTGSGQHRMMEIRYTQGVCRYATASTTIPVQTAPWPDA